MVKSGLNQNSDYECPTYCLTQRPGRALDITDRSAAVLCRRLEGKEHSPTSHTVLRTAQQRRIRVCNATCQAEHLGKPWDPYELISEHCHSQRNSPTSNGGLWQADIPPSPILTACTQAEGLSLDNEIHFALNLKNLVMRVQWSSIQGPSSSLRRFWPSSSVFSTILEGDSLPISPFVVKFARADF